MNRINSLLYLTPLLCISLILNNCQAQPSEKQTEDSYYQNGPRSYDGIGKYYMGREIAHVMGHEGASWLERPERDAEENTTQLLENFNLEEDEVVADIGAGTGYYSFRMAEQVPKGKVYAVDIQPEMLAMMQEKKKKEGIENVALVQGDLMSPNLPENAVDMILFVDVYHELSHPREMMEAIYRSMKPGARVVLVEYRMEDPKVPIKKLHKMSIRQAKKEMKAVGLKFDENISNLPWQHCMIFRKPVE